MAGIKEKLTSQTQTITGAKTFSDNVVLDGTSNTAPNQSSTWSSLGDTNLVTKAAVANAASELISTIIDVPMSSTADVSITDTGSSSSGLLREYLSMFTGTTSGSTTLARFFAGNTTAIATSTGSDSTTSNRGVNFTGRVEMTAKINLGNNTTTNGVSILKWGAPTGTGTVGDLTSKGIGIKISDNDLALQVHDGTTLETSASPKTLGNAQTYRIRIVSENGSVQLWVDGVLEDTTENGPTGWAGTSSEIVASVSNGADSAAQRLNVIDLKVNPS